MFDAAIEILRNWALFGQGENKKSAEAAIRLLEAAAKVTAQDLADGEWTRKVYPVLLAALPDAPKEEK